MRTGRLAGKVRQGARVRVQVQVRRVLQAEGWALPGAQESRARRLPCDSGCESLLLLLLLARSRASPTTLSADSDCKDRAEATIASRRDENKEDVALHCGSGGPAAAGVRHTDR